LGVGEEEEKQERGKWVPLWAGLAGVFTARVFLLEAGCLALPLSSFPYNRPLMLS